MNIKLRFSPVYWSVRIFIFAQLLTFVVVSRENVFLQVNHIYVPYQPPETVTLLPQPLPPAPPGEVPAPAVSSLGPILIYFASAVAVLGIVLFLVPVSALRFLLRTLFALLFSWGIFIILIFWLPAIPTIIIALAVGSTWFFVPKVWLHNMVMVLAMVSVGAVFGRLITPWTSMVLMAALAIYDFLAVRFGYMLWMTNKLSESNALPAFAIPRHASEWGSSLRLSSITELAEKKPSEREYSILGGGDIGFPLLLVSSTYFGYGFNSAIFLAVFSLVGLISAYWIQAAFLKGKPMPALPPIAVFCLIALLIVRFW